MSTQTSTGRPLSAPRALRAIGANTRGQIIELLRASPQTPGELSDTLLISAPAVSQHLRVLLDAQLVSYCAQGTQRIYQLRPEGLGELGAYLDSCARDARRASKSAATTGSRRYGAVASR